MNKVYSFLFIVLVMGLGFCAALLSYLDFYPDFFVIGTLMLAVLFIGAVLTFTLWLSVLFSFVFFGVVLLTGVILFPLLVVEDALLLALLLVVGSVGFVSVLLFQSCFSRRRKSMKIKSQQSVTITDIPPIPLPTEQTESQKQANQTAVTTYEVEKPTLQDLDLFTTMKQEDDFTLMNSETDKDFVELNEIERLMNEEQKTKVVRKKRRR